jgi:hypothetical protein
MADLTITGSDVQWQSGPVLGDQPAGGTIAAGNAVYLHSGTLKWLRAQADGTADEAGASGYGIALNASFSNGRLNVAVNGAIVALGTGTAGSLYVISATAGAIAPYADISTTGHYLTPLCLGIGNNQVIVLSAYHSGSVKP